MRVLFYSAVALAASLANGIRLEDMYEFGQLDANLNVKDSSGDATPGSKTGPVDPSKKVGIQMGNATVTANAGMDKEALAKLLDALKDKASFDPNDRKGDDCSCKEGIAEA